VLQRPSIRGLGEFVDADVQINGSAHGLGQYIAGLRAMVEPFPEYRWDLRHLLIDGDWLTAHFNDTGTHSGTFRGIPPTGRAISTQEFAIYGVASGKIVELRGVWVMAETSVLTQLTGA
jgi:predicted ester cyclase